MGPQARWWPGQAVHDDGHDVLADRRTVLRQRAADVDEDLLGEPWMDSESELADLLSFWAGILVLTFCGASFGDHAWRSRRP